MIKRRRAFGPDGVPIAPSAALAAVRMRKPANPELEDRVDAGCQRRGSYFQITYVPWPMGLTSMP